MQAHLSLGGQSGHRGLRTARVAGHFGEFLQGRLGPSGPLALVTLPCPALVAEARFRPGAFALHQTGARVVGPRQAAAFLARLGLERRGCFTLRLAMPAGGGAGSSTAALVALAHASGFHDSDLLGAACVATEGASDPLMFAEPGRLLWASRIGQRLARLPALPRMEIIGGFYGPAIATDPADCDFPDISDLVAKWPAACADLTRLAALASESARRTLDARGPSRDPTKDLAARLGATGWAIAHTGSARALIFPAGSVPDTAADALRHAGFYRITRFRIGGRA
jgi:uncharacterized protein involved in propanediol utilization